MRNICFLLVLALLSDFAIAQKAFEHAYYFGEVNSQKVNFILADGYIGASELFLIESENNKRRFVPEKGSLENNGDLKLHPVDDHKPKSHFLILGVLKSNEKGLPENLQGVYSFNQRTFRFSLKKVKSL